jgi:phage shock protein A
MSLNQFLLDVGCELQEILWKDVPRPPVAGYLDRIEASLHRASVELAQLRASVDELCKRLADKERQARRLEARVEVYLHVADQTNAWRHALELDRLRDTLARERARLLRRQQAYRAQLARVQHLQQRLDDFQSD